MTAVVGPFATPIAWIDHAGVHSYMLGDCLNYLTTGYQGIFGIDVVTESSVQDGIDLGIRAQAMTDVNAALVQAYNSFSPTNAQGVGLSSLVKLNGMKRGTPSYSTCLVKLIGQSLTTNIPPLAQMMDPNGNVWTVPATQIPAAGQINVVATCTTLGAVALPAGAVFTIKTFTIGWQAAVAAADAQLGSPVELDSALSARQAASTAGPAEGPLAAINGRVLAVPGVTASAPFQNDTDLADANGVPGHTVSLVVTGGDDAAVAAAIALKPCGVNTYGTTVIPVVDAYGVSHDIAFFRPIETQVFWYMTLVPLTGYSADVGLAIQAALSKWTNALAAGIDVDVSRATVAAQLNGNAQSLTYRLKSLQASLFNGMISASPIAVAFNARAVCAVGNIVIRTALS